MSGGGLSVLAQRFLFGSLLLGGSLGLLLWDHFAEQSFGFLALVGTLMTLGWWEFLQMLSLGRWRRFALGATALLGGFVCTWAAHTYGSEVSARGQVLLASAPWAGLLLVPALLIVSAFRRRPSLDELSGVALTTLGLVYLLVPVLCCLQLRFLPMGETWLLLLILVVKSNDIGAYLVGRQFGKTPLCAVSPKKTWEGTLGGLALGTAVAVAFTATDLPFSVGTAILLGLTAGVAGQVGDLAESFLKRSAGVKDSATLIPAFGGALDLLDSVLFGAPVLYAWALWTGGA